MIVVQPVNRYYNYHTVYTCTGYNSHPVMRSNACFSEVFNSGENSEIIHNTYRIKIFKPCVKLLIEGKANCSYLTTSDLKSFLHEGKIFHSTKAKQPKIKVEEQDTFWMVTLDVNDYMIVHRFLLTYIRFTYEFPFSFMLFEAIKMKKEVDAFRNEHILNLFHLVEMSNMIDVMYCYGHTFLKSDYIKNSLYIYDFKQLQKNFENENNKYFEDLLSKEFYLINNLVYNDLTNLSYKDLLKEFRNKQKRNERIADYYIPNYKKIIKKYGKNG